MTFIFHDFFRSYLNSFVCASEYQTVDFLMLNLSIKAFKLSSDKAFGQIDPPSGLLYNG